jgi:DNA repair exonuclease SbcCD nuclease subunit
MRSQPNIWILGDIHLFAETPWQLEVGKSIINWISSHELNREDTEVIILGDVIDKFKSLPPTHNLIISFLKAFKCSKIHLIVGNHDINKMPHSDFEKYQWIAYFYAQELGSQYIIYEYPQKFNIGNISFLALPYYLAPTFCLNDYSDKELFKKVHPQVDLDQPVDVVVAHVADINSGFPSGTCINIENLVGKDPLKILGHIHVADSSKDKIQYTGSLYTLRTNEKGQRYYWYYKDGSWDRKEVPLFCDLLSVNYGDPLPLSKYKDALPVYTIFNCPFEERARQMYGKDIFIRKTISNWESIRKSKEMDFGENISFVNILTKKDLINLFRKEMIEEKKEDFIGGKNSFGENKSLILKALNIIDSCITNNSTN